MGKRYVQALGGSARVINLRKKRTSKVITAGRQNC